MTRLTLGRAYASMFVLSTAFPVAASLLPATAVSRAMGLLDGAVALVLVVVGIYIVSVNPTTPEESVRHRVIAWYRVTAAVPLVLLVIFFLAGSHVRWDILLVGLAWRGWLLMYSLPAMLAMLWPADSKERFS